MKGEYRRALYEVYIILQNTDEEIKNRIPEKFINFIKENMDENHNFELYYGKDLTEQNLMVETKQILALIYRDYICSKEERNELLEKEQEKRLKKENENKEKYDINFEIRRSKNERKIAKEELYNKNETKLIELRQEKWYEKIKNKIFKVFRIKNGESNG